MGVSFSTSKNINEIFLKVQLFGKYIIVQHGIVHVEIILKLKILNIIALNVIYSSCNAKKNILKWQKQIIVFENTIL